MKDKNISVLFMDDEPASEIVQVAVEWMEEEGFEVDLAESMSEAVESYYKKFYDVFVLDIDMSHIPDEQEGDGVNVLKRFISLHNRTRVIMFSGAGTVPHWFEAANAHCYAYVHKNEDNAVPSLIRYIKQGADAYSTQGFFPSKKKCPEQILLFDKDDKYSKLVKDTIAGTLGKKWGVRTEHALENVLNIIEQKADDYAMILLFQDIFKLYASEKNILTSLFSCSPRPQIIIGCCGKDEFQYSILFLANLHPFRMINILKDNWQERLAQAVKKAGIWYGQQEIFQADPAALKRLEITLPPEALEQWEEYEDQDDMQESYDADEKSKEE